MSVDLAGLRRLSAADKLMIIEMLWDDLGTSSEPIPLPEWVDKEATRRRVEMQMPSVGLTHDEIWGRIKRRN